MPLTKAQLMAVPGGPGVVGAVQAGSNVTIVDGVLSAGGEGVGTVKAGANIILDPVTGIGDVTISATPYTTSNAAGEDDFPAGTVLSFLQASAPSGWTKNTNINNAGLRITSGNGGGTGGTANFTAAFTSVTVAGSATASYTTSGNTSSVSLTASGSSSISGSSSGTAFQTKNLPSHIHAATAVYNASGNLGAASNSGGAFKIGQMFQSTVSGSDQAHSHSFSGTATLSGSSAVSHAHGYTLTGNATGTLTGGTTLNLGVKYVDLILCTKN